MTDTREKVIFTFERTRIVKEISTFEVEAKTEGEAWKMYNDYLSSPLSLHDGVDYRKYQEEMLYEDSKVFYIPLGEGDE